MAASPGVRISGGVWRGRALKVAPGVRPTESRVREALLSIWQDRVPGARVLDLFAGSGAVGLEARSRGAASVLLVENDARAWRALSVACREWEAGAKHSVRAIHDSHAIHAIHAVQAWRGTLPGTLVDLARHGTAPFDLVFADPPYAWTEHPRLLALLRPLLAPGAEIALEHSARTPLDSEFPGFEPVSRRTYGETALSFFAAAGAAAAEAAQGRALENATITGSGTEATGAPPTRAGKKRQSRR